MNLVSLAGFAPSLLTSIALFACSDSAPASPSSVAPGAGDDAGPADAAVADATQLTDAGASDAAPTGKDPIVAPPDQWTWVDFPDSKCASGTPTGLSVNPHAGASDVLIYLEGGGACTSATSCWGPEPKAVDLDGYDGTKFNGQPQKKYPIFARGSETFAAQNPFAAMNMVYVPYCTGDLHAGTAEVDMRVNGATKPTYFWGAKDLDLFLARLVPTFPNAKHIWLAGTSAGGYGSFLDFDKVAKAFGVRVDIIDDSGPAILPKGGSQNGALALWGFVAPSGCSPCTSEAAVLAAARKSQPASRYAFLSYSQDTVISKDTGYTVDEFPAVLDAFLDTLKDDSNAASFIVTNKQSHVVQSNLLAAPQYLPWLAQMASDDPAWTSTTYASPGQ